MKDDESTVPGCISCGCASAAGSDPMRVLSRASFAAATLGLEVEGA